MSFGGSSTGQAMTHRDKQSNVADFGKGVPLPPGPHTLPEGTPTGVPSGCGGLTPKPAGADCGFVSGKWGGFG